MEVCVRHTLGVRHTSCNLLEAIMTTFPWIRFIKNTWSITYSVCSQTC